MALAEKHCVTLQDIMEDIENYFDDRADADCEGDPPRYVPNEAMQMFVKVKEARFWIDQLIRNNCNVK